MPNHNPKVLIFDMDGVLIDSIEISLREAMNIRPEMTPMIYREVLCGNFHEEIGKLTLPHIKETQEEAEKRREEYGKKKACSPMYPGTKELLEKLHTQGYVLVLNSSAFQKNCWPLLEKYDLVRLFDFIADAEVSKSKVEKFKLIEEKYLVPKEDLLFITDTLGDIREADQAGVPTIAVTWGAHDRSYFMREPHANLVGVADTIEELQGFLELEPKAISDEQYVNSTPKKKF